MFWAQDTSNYQTNSQKELSTTYPLGFKDEALHITFRAIELRWICLWEVEEKASIGPHVVILHVELVSSKLWAKNAKKATDFSIVHSNANMRNMTTCYKFGTSK